MVKNALWSKHPIIFVITMAVLSSLISFVGFVTGISAIMGILGFRISDLSVLISMFILFVGSIIFVVYAFKKKNAINLGLAIGLFFGLILAIFKLLEMSKDFSGYI